MPNEPPGGRSGVSQTRSPSTTGTPVTGTSYLPHAADLAAQLASTGPVKNYTDAISFLESRSLIAVNGNYTTETLANVLLTASFEDKIPKITVSIMRAIGFLMVKEYHSGFTDELATAFGEKLISATEPLTKELERERAFLQASNTDQAKHTTDIKEAAKTLTTTSQQINSATANLNEISKGIQPALKSVTDATDAHIKSLADSAKVLAEAAKVLQEVSSQSAPSQQPSPPGSQPTYANIAANGSQSNTTTLNSSFNSQQPDHVVQTTNRLLISAKQAYVSYEANDPKVPKDRGGPAAFQLRMKLNNRMKEIDTITKQVTEMSGFAIRALQFTERSAILLEFDSVESVKRFKTHCAENSLLTNQICPSAKLQPHSFRVIMKFVPCTGEFTPSDRSHLREIEEDLGLPEGSIMTATWIKKPENRSPNQTTANVKVICATAEAANKLLTERIFIANSRVVVTKDLQEPIRCNKCQEYGHIRESCNNPERCATCAQEHATTTCKNQAEPHCVSCGTSSTHASSDRNKCAVFAKRANALDSRLPENSMPYFPVLNQPWTFVLAPKNVNHSSPHNIRPRNSQQQNQHTDATSQRRNPSQQTTQSNRPSQPRVQTTLQNAGQFNFPPGYAPDAGWPTITRSPPPQTTQPNPNALPLGSFPRQQAPNPLPMQFQAARFYTNNNPGVEHAGPSGENSYW